MCKQIQLCTVLRLLTDAKLIYTQNAQVCTCDFIGMHFIVLQHPRRPWKGRSRKGHGQLQVPGQDRREILISVDDSGQTRLNFNGKRDNWRQGLCCGGGGWIFLFYFSVRYQLQPNDRTKVCVNSTMSWSVFCLAPEAFHPSRDCSWNVIFAKSSGPLLVDYRTGMTGSFFFFFGLLSHFVCARDSKTKRVFQKKKKKIWSKVSRVNTRREKNGKTKTAFISPGRRQRFFT